MSKARTVLIKLEIVLIILILFFSLIFILSHSILPAFGIDICGDVSGISMNPTITEGALIIGKRMPYEELQVGDIITFKKIDHIIQTVDENGQTHDEVVFLDNENITHRIVSIDVKGIHTKGDNEDADFYPVDESRYVAQVVWWNNYLGRPFRLMFGYKGLLWLIGAAVVLGIGLMVLWMIEQRS